MIDMKVVNHPDVYLVIIIAFRGKPSLNCIPLPIFLSIPAPRDKESGWGGEGGRDGGGEGGGEALVA